MRRAIKPTALRHGAQVAVVSPASAAEPESLARGLRELSRLGYPCSSNSQRSEPQGYFAADEISRRRELEAALYDPEISAIFCARGGYGSAYLLERVSADRETPVKILLGYSDITSLEIFLWQKLNWVTFYGPMVAAGLDAGADVPGGYDAASCAQALTETRSGWTLDLRGEPLMPGEAEGVLLGGCLTLVETSLATPWELDTTGAILLLEDRGMKPYQMDRALLHLKQAGKFSAVRGILLGEFPDSAPPVEGAPTVRDVCRRILGELGVPIFWGAPVGHTPRAMLTVPLGVHARLRAVGTGLLEILEPAVNP